MNYFPTILGYTDSDSDDLPIVPGIEEAMSKIFLDQLSDLSQRPTNSTPPRN